MLSPSVAEAAARRFRDELTAVADDAALADLIEYDAATDTYNEFESADFVVNNLAAIRYALNAGLPVISWTQAQKNPSAQEKVLRAIRQFEDQAKLLVLAYVNGVLSLADFRRLLVLNFRRQSRNSYVAGRRSVGDLRPLPPQAEQELEAIIEDDSDDLDGGMSLDPTLAAGGSLAAIVGRMLFDPSNYLGSGLPGDPLAGLPAPIGAGKHSDGERAAKQFTGSMSNFGDRIRSYSHAGELSALAAPGNSTLVWWTLGYADHCVDCIRLADGSPYYAAVLETNGLYPGSGHTTCGGRCRCGLQYDVPDEVCGDSLAVTSDVADVIEAVRILVPDGSKLNVWVQEAASCKLPVSIESLNPEGDYTDVTTDAEAFSWGEDVASLITGSAGSDTIGWAEAKAVKDAHAKAVKSAFAFLANELKHEAEGLQFTRYEAGGSVYVAAWRKTGGAVRFEAGTTVKGATLLDPEFTLHALHDLSAMAGDEGLALTISGRYAGPGMRKWLDTLGTPQTTSVAVPPSIVIEHTLPTVGKAGLDDAIARVAANDTKGHEWDFETARGHLPEHSSPNHGVVMKDFGGDAGIWHIGWYGPDGELKSAMQVTAQESSGTAGGIVVATRDTALKQGYATRLYDYAQDETPFNLYPAVGNTTLTPVSKKFAASWLEHRKAIDVLPEFVPPSAPSDPAFLKLLADQPFGATPTGTYEKTRWTNTADMVLDLEARYPNAQFDDLLKLDFEVAKVAAETIDRLLTRFGSIPSFKGVRLYAGHGASIAEVKSIEKDVSGSAVFLPTSIWTDKAKLKALTESQGSATFSTATQVVSAAMKAGEPVSWERYADAVITHEMGHEYMGMSLHSRFGLKGDPVRTAVDDWYTKLRGKEASAEAAASPVPKGVTEYGKKNGHEAWAEVFTAAVIDIPASATGPAKELRAILDEFYPPGSVAIGPLLGADVTNLGDKLTDRYGKWFEALTPEQKATLTKYKDGQSDGINDYLRGKTTAEQVELQKALGFDVAAAISVLDTAFEDAATPDAQVVVATQRLKKPMTVYRGRVEAAIPEVGDVIGDAGFVSTSIDAGQAAQFAHAAVEGQHVVYRIVLPKNTPAVWTNSFFGEKYASEQEVLLQRGSKFKVVKTTPGVDIPLPDGAPGGLVTVVDLIPGPEPLVAALPAIPFDPAAAKTGWKPGDTSLIETPGAAAPINAPLREWSGKVPDSPALPPLVVSPEEKTAAAAAATAAQKDWHAIMTSDVTAALSWTKQDATDAVSAGLVYEKVGDTRLIGRTEADLVPLKAYLDVAGHTANDTEFWHMLGYSNDDINAFDLNDALKGGKKRLTAGVMVFEPDGRVWVIAPKNKYAGYDNTVIKGGVDVDETAAAAAIREVREEAGISAELDAYLGDYQSGATGITRMYVGHRTGGGPLFAGTHETYRVKLLTPDEAQKALTRYGLPDVRDQAILHDAVEMVAGSPPVVDYQFGTDALPDFHAVTKPVPSVPPAIPEVQPPTLDPFAFTPEQPVFAEPSLSTAFGYDAQMVKKLDTFKDIPASTKFPIAQTRWELPGNQTQAMYWKLEAHPGGGEHVFWMNSKKQVDDPHLRLNVHVAQLLKFEEDIAAMQFVPAALRVNDALLDQVPKLREMLASAGAIKPTPGTTELTIDQLSTLATAIRTGTPAPSVEAFIPTAPLAPEPVALVHGINGETVGKMLNEVVADVADTFDSGSHAFASFGNGGVTAKWKLYPSHNTIYVWANPEFLSPSEQMSLIHSEALLLADYVAKNGKPAVVFQGHILDGLSEADLHAVLPFGEKTIDGDWTIGAENLAALSEWTKADLKAFGQTPASIFEPTPQTLVTPAFEPTVADTATGIDGGANLLVSKFIDSAPLHEEGAYQTGWLANGNLAGHFEWSRNDKQIVVTDAMVQDVAHGGPNALARQVHLLADMTELVPTIGTVEWSETALGMLPGKLRNLLAPGWDHGAVKFSAEEMRGIRDGLFTKASLLDLPTLAPGPLPQSLGYDPHALVGWTGGKWKSDGLLTLYGIIAKADVLGADVIAHGLTNATDDDLLKAGLGSLYDMAGFAALHNLRLLVKESEYSQDIVAALVHAGGVRKAGYVILEGDARKTFQDLVIPSAPLAPIAPIVPAVLVAPAEASPLLDLVKASADTNTTFLNAAMKSTSYTTAQGSLLGQVVWRRWSNTLEVHALGDVPPVAFKAHLVRMAETFDAFPKLEALRITTAAMPGLSDDMLKLILDNGGKLYAGGIRLTKADTVALRGKLLADAVAAVPAPPTVALTWLSEQGAATSKSLTHTFEGLKYFDRFHYHPADDPTAWSGTGVIIVQRSLAKELLWARTLGDTDMARRFDASVAHMVKLGLVDLPAKPQWERIRIENLEQLPKTFTAMLKLAGATGDEGVLYLGRDDAMKFAKELSADMGTALGTVTGLAPAKVSEADLGLLGIAGHDPAVFKTIIGSGYTIDGTLYNQTIWDESASSALTHSYVATWKKTPTGLSWNSFIPGDALGFTEPELQAAWLHQLVVFSLGGKPVRIEGAAFYGQAGQAMKVKLLELGAQMDDAAVLLPHEMLAPLVGHIVDGAPLLPLAGAATPAAATTKLSAQFGFSSEFVGNAKTSPTNWGNGTGGVIVEPATGGAAAVKWVSGVSGGGDFIGITDVVAAQGAAKLDTFLAAVPAFHEGLAASGASKLIVFEGGWQNEPKIKEILLAVGGTPGAGGVAVTLDKAQLETLAQYVIEDKPLAALGQGSASSFASPALKVEPPPIFPPGLEQYEVAHYINSSHIAVTENVNAATGETGIKKLMDWGSQGTGTSWTATETTALFTGIGGNANATESLGVALAQIHYIAKQAGDWPTWQSVRITDGVFKAMPPAASAHFKTILKQYGAEDGITHLTLTMDQLGELAAGIEHEALGTPFPAGHGASLLPSGPPAVTGIPLHQKYGFDAEQIQSMEAMGSISPWAKNAAVQVRTPGQTYGQYVSNAYVKNYKARLIWRKTLPHSTGYPPVQDVAEAAVVAAGWHQLKKLAAAAVEQNKPLWMDVNALRKAGQPVKNLVESFGAKDKTLAKFGVGMELKPEQAKKMLLAMNADPLVAAKTLPEIVPLDTLVKGPPPAVAGVVTLPPAQVVTPTPAVTVAPVTAASTISGVYKLDSTALEAMLSDAANVEVHTVAAISPTPAGHVRLSHWVSPTGVSTVRWAEEKFGDALILRIRDVNGAALGSSGPTALMATLAHDIPLHMKAYPGKFTNILLDNKAVAPNVADLLTAFGAKQTKTYWRITPDQIAVLSKQLGEDSAPWIGKVTIPEFTPAVAPTGPVVLPKGGAPTIATPSFIYGYGADAKAWSLGDVVKSEATINNEVKTVFSPVALHKGNAGVAWSVSPSGKALGVFNVVAGATNAETRDAAFAMIAKVIDEGKTHWGTDPKRDKLFFKSDAYDAVPGLKQMLMDAGGVSKDYANLGEAIELNPAQAEAFAAAIRSDTMGKLKVSIATSSEYLAYSDSEMEKLLLDPPKTFPGGHQWKAAEEDVQAHVTLIEDGRTAEFTGMAGGGSTAHVLAAAAELNYLAELGMEDIFVGTGVLGLVPKLDKFLLAVGGKVDGEGIRLDASAVNEARKYISKDALPTLLGGKPLPYSIVDEMAANGSVVAAAAHATTITPVGVKQQLTAKVGEVGVSAVISRSDANIYWHSIDRPSGSTAGQRRAAATAHLRSLLNMAAQDASVGRLDVDVAVLNELPVLRGVLAKYGAKEVPGTQHYLTLDRPKLIKLRSDLDAELTGLTATQGVSYIGHETSIIVWPAADELHDVPTHLSGQTAKNLLADKDGNQWLFKPGDSGRGAATDRAVAELALALGLPVPPVRIYTVLINGKPVTGSLQKMLANGKAIHTVSELTPGQTAQMLRHSVLDWLTNNDDAHIGNWLIDDKAQLWAIDKSRSWSTLNDGLHDTLKTDNEGNGGGTPLLFRFWRDVKTNPDLLRNIKPQDLAPTLRAIRNMTDDEFKRIVEPVTKVTERGKYKGQPEKMLAAMLARKNSVVADFEKYFEGEVRALDRAKPGELPTTWKKWLDDPHFNLDATQQDLTLERLGELNSRFGTYDWATSEGSGKYRNYAEAPHLGGIRNNIRSYFGGGYGKGQKDYVKGYGAELIRPKLNPKQEQEWRELTEWALLNIVTNPRAVAPGGYGQAELARKWFNPETGRFRLIRSTNRYADKSGRRDNPEAYVEGFKKEGLRNMFGTAIGSHVIVAGRGGVFYYLEAEPNQLFSSMILGYGAGEGEAEILVADPRPDQILHIRSQNNRLDLETWLKWEGGNLTG